MKSFLKFTLLLTLVVAGRLSKPSVLPALAAQPKAAAGTNVVLVSQRNNMRSKKISFHRSGPARAHVLSVFFK